MPRVAVTFNHEGFAPDLIVRTFDEGLRSKGDMIRLQSGDDASGRLIRILNVVERLDTSARMLRRVLVLEMPNPKAQVHAHSE
jgi:hypothetical protein